MRASYSTDITDPAGRAKAPQKGLDMTERETWETIMWEEFREVKAMIQELPWWSRKQKAELQELADRILAELVSA